MQSLNILPGAPASIPPGPELSSMTPSAVIAERAPVARGAAGLGVSNILSCLSPLLPVAGIGFLTWLGADMILGGALGNPFTPKGAKRVA
ncbi:hypothetical protein HYW84_00330 [Candidatus Peregrinibacteria bacterium]|nr:hypothetical protein [Candidatus Peregrinibacteria bacterium]